MSGYKNSSIITTLIDQIISIVQNETITITALTNQVVSFVRNTIHETVYKISVNSWAGRNISKSSPPLSCLWHCDRFL